MYFLFKHELQMIFFVKGLNQKAKEDKVRVGKEHKALVETFFLRLGKLPQTILYPQNYLFYPLVNRGYILSIKIFLDMLNPMTKTNLCTAVMLLMRSLCNTSIYCLDYIILTLFPRKLF